jgi:hypothetical protein
MTYMCGEGRRQKMAAARPATQVGGVEDDPDVGRAGAEVLGQAYAGVGVSDDVGELGFERERDSGGPRGGENGVERFRQVVPGVVGGVVRAGPPLVVGASAAGAEGDVGGAGSPRGSATAAAPPARMHPNSRKSLTDPARVDAAATKSVGLSPARNLWPVLGVGRPTYEAVELSRAQSGERVDPLRARGREHLRPKMINHP